jgi:hypothetical protein
MVWEPGRSAMFQRSVTPRRGIALALGFGAAVALVSDGGPFPSLCWGECMVFDYPDG